MTKWISFKKPLPIVKVRRVTGELETSCVLARKPDRIAVRVRMQTMEFSLLDGHAICLGGSARVSKPFIEPDSLIAINTHIASITKVEKSEKNLAKSAFVRVEANDSFIRVSGGDDEVQLFVENCADIADVAERLDAIIAWSENRVRKCFAMGDGRKRTRTKRSHTRT